MRTFSLCGSRAWVSEALLGWLPSAGEGLMLTCHSRDRPGAAALAPYPGVEGISGSPHPPAQLSLVPQALALHTSGLVPHPGANRALASAETLGVLVRAVGEPMRPLAEECCQLGLGLCDQVDDPDLRRCT